MVNTTDEALVMQVVTCYFPRWALGEEVDDDDETHGGGVGKRSGGAKKGEKNTGSRTIHIFAKYNKKFKEARNSKFSGKWDEKLQNEAINQHELETIEKEKNVEHEKEDESPIVNGGFDVDMINGCFDNYLEDDGVEETGTTVTPV
jgi:hypothetical protein